MKYWWVNQNKTHRHEVDGGYMWSPKTNTNGARNQFYINMTLVSVGDVVFSYYQSQIRAIGIVQETAITSKKPIEFKGDKWNPEGWFVATVFSVLKHPVKPKDHINIIRDLLPEKYAPLQKNGDGKELYLAHINEPLALALINLFDGQVEAAVNSHTIDNQDEGFEKEQKAEEEISSRSDITETEKKQLVKARRGQSLFRSRVMIIENSCRITGVSEKSHLRASHIKPWVDSNDEEKLDGNNGLLLSPHIDHLFDRGYISFSNEGDLMVSPKLNKEILKTWSIESDGNFGSFNQLQCKFLAFHRQSKFLS